MSDDRGKKDKELVSSDKIFEESLKLRRLRREREIKKWVKGAKKKSKEFLQRLEETAMKALDQEMEEIRATWNQNKNGSGYTSFYINYIDQLNMNGNGNVAGYLESGDVPMGDTYNVNGQAGAVGSNAHAHDMTFNQVVSHLEKSIDLSELATQLSELRQAISEKQDSSPQTAIALGKLAEAEIAAKEKKISKVVESLKAAGKWTLDLAKEIGKDVAVEAIKKSMGMP